MMEICESNKKIIKAFLCLLLPRCESYGFAAVVESHQNHIQPQISTQNSPPNPKFSSVESQTDQIQPQIFPQNSPNTQCFAVVESQQIHIQPQISSQLPKNLSNPAWRQIRKGTVYTLKSDDK